MGRLWASIRKPLGNRRDEHNGAGPNGERAVAVVDPSTLEQSGAAPGHVRRRAMSDLDPLMLAHAVQGGEKFSGGLITVFRAFGQHFQDDCLEQVWNR